MADILLQERTEEGILILTLNRPEAMNCFNFDLLAALADAIREANFDMGLRCIVITGAGGEDAKKASFSTGADLKERRTMSPDQVRRFIFTIRNTFTAVEQVRVPVIAAINGFAFGGGMELALACDLRIASSNAIMGLTETSLAIIPGAGGTQRLPRIVGIAKAKELIFTARRIDAKTALEIGLGEPRRGTGGIDAGSAGAGPGDREERSDRRRPGEVCDQLRNGGIAGGGPAAGVQGLRGDHSDEGQTRGAGRLRGETEARLQGGIGYSEIPFVI